MLDDNKRVVAVRAGEPTAALLELVALRRRLWSSLAAAIILLVPSPEGAGQGGPVSEAFTTH